MAGKLQYVVSAIGFDGKTLKSVTKPTKEEATIELNAAQGDVSVMACSVSSFDSATGEITQLEYFNRDKKATRLIARQKKLASLTLKRLNAAKESALKLSQEAEGAAELAKAIDKAIEVAVAMGGEVAADEEETEEAPAA